METRADNFRFVTKLSYDFFTKLTIPDATYISELFNDVNNNKKKVILKKEVSELLTVTYAIQINLQIRFIIKFSVIVICVI